MEIAKTSCLLLPFIHLSTIYIYVKEKKKGEEKSVRANFTSVTLPTI